MSKSLKTYDSTPYFQELRRFRDILRFPFEDPPSPEFLAAIEALSSDRRCYPDPTLLYSIGPFLGVQSPESHLGPQRNAVDFVLPIGTPVLAAHRGRITAIEDGHSHWGAKEEYSLFCNYITISYRPTMEKPPTHHHRMEDWYWFHVQYSHLARGSVRKLKLRVGQMVEAGQVIAQTGRSGWMTAPHLHVLGFVNTEHSSENPFGYLSMKMTFRTAEDWDYYYAHDFTWPGDVEYDSGHLD
jgi:hypothetical protein